MIIVCTMNRILQNIYDTVGWIYISGNSNAAGYRFNLKISQNWQKAASQVTPMHYLPAILGALGRCSLYVVSVNVIKPAASRKLHLELSKLIYLLVRWNYNTM